ncbi:hypothetical protein KIPB_007792 [Kipferlia bialata]|uniref:OBG-type G domain-containing protein n=1 Tax=Kipferlia bialata TaxID=797122 RepID=A0A9K3CZ26_9EUKA|nr:hypothetical protein KIPB_007792 [Kipferlia bialata]|eukprot:g7792.t1
MSLVDRIESIEAEINKTQRNKNTEHHIGRLKAKLSTLRRDLIVASSKGSKGGGSGFDVAKTGHARVGMIGFPSVGKSTLLTALTEAKSEVASYEFTTLTAIPGTFNHKGAKVQLVDLPGIIEGAKDNKGRGRQVIATARTADLLLIMLDSTKPVGLKRKVEKELFGFGIRLNQTPPDISYRQIDRGGILLSSPCRDSLKYLSQETVESVCREMKINHADICVRDVNCTVDDLIDAIEGNRVYMPALYVMNKIDAVTIEVCRYMYLYANVYTA